MRLPRRGAVFVLALASALAGCFEMSSLRDLQKLSAAINERYHEQAGINLTNGDHLTITFQNSKYATLPADSRQAFALDVARFAFAQYAQRDSLQSVSVGFRAVEGAAGFTLTRSEVPYSWSGAELRAMVGSARAASTVLDSVVQAARVAGER